MKSGLLTVLLLCLPLAVQAQTVYESKSGQGKVYSDRPLPGGKAVDLRPLNVIEPVPVPPPSATSSPSISESVPDRRAAASYRSLAVTFPEPNGSVAANNATFEVRVAVDPPLQIDKGHAFTLRMDGRPVPGRYTSTEMMIPPEFFGDVAPAGVQRHVLEVGIVDAGGVTLLVSPSVEFQTRFVNVLQRPRMQPLPMHPSAPPPPRWHPAPEPRPAPEPQAWPARPRSGAGDCTAGARCRDAADDWSRMR